MANLLDKKEAKEKLKSLGEGWRISSCGKNLRKNFKFKGFAQALKFTNEIGKLAEKMGHHPDLKLGWGYVDFSSQTHVKNGLTNLDFELAEKTEKIK